MSSFGGVVRHRIRFLREYFASPRTVGSVAPSSRQLARALCEPYQAAEDPASVLEVGAGTGAVTRHLGEIMRPADRLDVCEVSRVFVEALRRNVLTLPRFSGAVAEGRVRVFDRPVQDLAQEGAYDFVISGLPLTAFEPPDVCNILGVIRRLLKPDGVFSYFEYVGLRHLTRTFAVGRERRRIREVSRCLSENIRRHQFHRRTVLLNVPPAHARHCRFDA